ncbi:outer membrane beta-barrel protein [Thalassolituus marinus]|uniref:Outer membrane beta-barrel protein n=1 Tax=Thalassolituus marinus TaxID=671053 RepID=A0ABS7ZVC8_9GAMM|nr:outer membrane beta-barrel protein [Thalassolituus marinus]MCA6065078.1 outer membrane beta-barrel protein [Thalassolituus marinus]
MKKMIATGLMMLAVPAVATAEGFDQSKLRLGAGFNNNVIDSPFGGSSIDALGFSLFAGYELDNNMSDVTTSVEAGYNQTEDFINSVDSDVSGLWVAGVAEKNLSEINPRLFAMARLGLDLGDDDGLFLGAGVGMHLNEKVDLRGEYINKDATTVYQISAVLNF